MGLIKVIAVAYNRTIPLRILCDCFLVQTDPRWELHIIHDGMASDEVKRMVPSDPRIHFYESEVRNGRYGHPNRRGMLSTLEAAVNDFFLLTNDDNYYVPDYVKYIHAHTTPRTGIIYHDCMHNYYAYDVLKSKLRINYIDMGSFVVRADVAKAVGFTSNEYHADGIYAEQCSAFCGKHGLETVYIPKCLFVHN